MKATLKVDTSEFQRQLRIYLKERGLGVEQALRKQTGLLVKDMIKATPPFTGRSGGKGTFSQSFAAQRRVGRKAVERDVSKAFAPAVSRNTLRAIAPADARRVRRYLRTGEDAKLLTMLHRMRGGKGSVSGSIAHRATLAAHQLKRSATTGRVVGPRQQVRNAPSINKVKRERVGHVGRWKAGWMPAVRELRIKGIPKWIAGQDTNRKGYVRPQFRRLNPAIVVANLVRGESGRNISIAQAAIQNRTRAMTKELQKRHAHAARKARFS